MSKLSCAFCGFADIPESAQFCPNCGKPLSAAGRETESKPVTITVEPDPDSYCRPLTDSELGLLQRIGAKETKVAQIIGPGSIFWGLIGLYAPDLDRAVYGGMALGIGILGMILGLAARSSRRTTKEALANGMAVEYTGVSRLYANERRVELNGGYLQFSTASLPRILDEATNSDGKAVKIAFTEWGKQTEAGGEVMLLVVNGRELDALFPGLLAGVSREGTTDTISPPPRKFLKRGGKS